MSITVGIVNEGVSLQIIILDLIFIMLVELYPLDPVEGGVLGDSVEFINGL